jgi:hypothetical protein
MKETYTRFIAAYLPFPITAVPTAESGLSEPLGSKAL